MIDRKKELPFLPSPPLGLKYSAVAVTDTGKTKLLGNDRQNKYLKRKDQAHKMSREIVGFAQASREEAVAPTPILSGSVGDDKGEHNETKG